MKLRVLRSPESKSSHFERLGLYVRDINLTQKQIVAEAPNWMVYVCMTSRCYLNFLQRLDYLIQEYIKDYLTNFVLRRNSFLEYLNIITTPN